jgi:hypothetical protein
MFHFLNPFPDGTVSHIMLGGKDLAEAFDEYRRYWWLLSTPGAVAVFLTIPSWRASYRSITTRLRKTSRSWRCGFDKSRHGGRHAPEMDFGDIIRIERERPPDGRRRGASAPRR